MIRPLVAALLALCCPLAAQEDAMPAGPSDAAKSLHRLVGKWVGKGVSRQGPGMDSVPWTANNVVTKMFDGYFVREDIEIAFGMPSTMRMTSVYGHDRSRDQLTGYAMSNSGGMVQTRLRWTSDSTLIAVASTRYQRSLVAGRSTWMFEGDTYEFQHERMTDAGDWFVEIEGQFKRDDSAEIQADPGAFMSMPAPEPMQQLGVLCGDYRMSGEMKMFDSPNMEVAARETVRSVFGGHIVSSVAKSPELPGGMVWEGHSWLAWDGDSKHYWSLMADNMGEFNRQPMWRQADGSFVQLDSRLVNGYPSVSRTVIRVKDGRMAGFEVHTTAGTEAPFLSFKASYEPVSGG